jgi:hypothetical protein
MKKKLIYIASQYVSKKIYKDYYIKDFLKNNYDIEFWSVEFLRIFRRTKYKKKFKNLRTHKIKNYNIYINLIKKNLTKNICYIVLTPYCYDTLNVYIALKKFNCNYCSFSWGHQPNLTSNGNLLKKTLIFLLSFNNFSSSLLNLYKVFISKTAKKINLVRKSDISFNTGKKINIGKKNVNINLCDYEKYLDAKKVDKKKNQNTTVFLDINYPFPFDLKTFDYKLLTFNYYKSMRNFFDFFEKKYSTKIIICPHPSRITDNKNLFGSRVYVYDIANAVKNCSYVISHASISLSYAVLNYKPIILFCTNDIKNIFYEYSNHVEIFKVLKCNLVVENDYNFKIKKVNKSCYDRYKYKYITNKKLELMRNFPIVKREIDNLISL